MFLSIFFSYMNGNKFRLDSDLPSTTAAPATRTYWIRKRVFLESSDSKCGIPGFTACNLLSFFILAKSWLSQGCLRFGWHWTAKEFRITQFVNKITPKWIFASPFPPVIQNSHVKISFINRLVEFFPSPQRSPAVLAAKTYHELAQLD